MESQATSLTILVCVLAVSCVVQASPVQDLMRLYKEFFEWRMEDRPMQATAFDVPGYDDKLESWDPQMFPKRYERAEGLKSKLSAIKRESLSVKEKVNYDILKNDLDTYIEGYAFINYTYINPVSNMGGPHKSLNDWIRFTKFKTRGDFDNYITRLEAIPKYLRELIVLMERAIALNRTLHAASMSRVDKQFEKITNITDPYDSPLYTPFKDDGEISNSTIPQAKRSSYRQRALTAVNDVHNAYGSMRQFVKHQYMPHTRTHHGVWSWEGGKDFYRAVMKWYLSVDMSPEEVHELGLKEVDRIHTLMKKIMMKQNLGNKTVSEYFNMWKQDPNFYFTTADEVLVEYQKILDAVKPLMSKYFSDDAPDLPLQVKATKEDGVFGYYNRGTADGSKAGTFFINLHRPKDVLKPGMKPLALHEAIPGHHTQISYVITAQNPNFRSKPEYSLRHRAPFAFPKFTAVLEGWALYAEYLGEEMGVYKTDYEMMGRYSSEMFRACRLVVDSGIHYFKWNRTRAIDYMKKYISASYIEFEVDRYITWPGQALSYKVGEIKLKELRKMATQALGNKFDIKGFHTAVLENGGQPLSVLTTTIQSWIDDVKAKTKPVGTTCPPVSGAAAISTLTSLSFVLLSSLYCFIAHY
ncbi:uncharacterized protein LOC121373370 [Gigantopelta aegis]|uniref:uncharacterized protein LOC121373370 n=1 Tax=Gigantopelta aegis TaxID=1735272 RepID=UPI001B88E5FE|nr:uncharacterized protein LOC121373370 [Gigantopelta aegis]